MRAWEAEELRNAPDRVPLWNQLMGSEMEAEAEHRRGEGDQQSEINLARGKQQDCDSVEQRPISLRSRRTGSIEAEAHKRSTSMLSTKTVKIKEAKDFSKIRS